MTVRTHKQIVSLSLSLFHSLFYYILDNVCKHQKYGLLCVDAMRVRACAFLIPSIYQTYNNNTIYDESRSLYSRKPRVFASSTRIGILYSVLSHQTKRSQTRQLANVNKNTAYSQPGPYPIYKSILFFLLCGLLWVRLQIIIRNKYRYKKGVIVVKPIIHCELGFGLFSN